MTYLIIAALAAALTFIVYRQLAKSAPSSGSGSVRDDGQNVRDK